jgi:DNA-binding transcriptional MerR regulator
MSYKPTKLYYRIGEVCKIVEVEAHVLRYWESEFPKLSPPKNRAGQRTYRPKDIELLLQIKKLLYEDGFTIAGARRRLAATVSNSKQPTKRQKQTRGKRVSEAPKKRLNEARKELENILTLLERG